MATTVFPESGDQITEAAWTSANKTLSVATEYRVIGYALSAGTGLNVDISAGTCFVNGFEIVSDATQSESVTASQTNYVYLNDDGTITVNTTGTQPADSLFLGMAVTDGSGVTSVSHVRNIDNGVNALKIKASDESVTSSTTLQNDDDLTWDAVVEGVYEILIGLYVTNGNFKFDLYGVSTADNYTYQAGNSLIFGDPGTPESTNEDYILIRSVQRVNSTPAGLKWAQNASSGTATTVKAGSFLYAKRLLG